MPSDLAELSAPLPAALDGAFARVRAQVHADAAGKWDLPALRRDLRLSGGRLCLPEANEGEFPTALSLSPWARAQACQKLGIPAAYFARCAPGLQDAQFNHWLWRGLDYDADDDWLDPSPGSDPRAERWLLRCRGNTARAVLSSRYAVLDNRDVLAALAPALDRRYRVTWSALTDASFHLRLVDPDRNAAASKGDDLMAGVHVANSEVGARSLTVDALVWRQVCTNGLVRLVKGKSLLSRRHVAIRPDRLRDGLHQAIFGAFNEASAFLDRFAAASKWPVPDPEGTVLALAERWGLTNSFAEEVRWALASEAGTRSASLYSLVNAVTRAAQALEADERYRLERLAGELVETGPPPPLRAKPPKEGEPPRRSMRAPGQPARVAREDEEDEDALRAARPLLGRL